MYLRNWKFEKIFYVYFFIIFFVENHLFSSKKDENSFQGKRLKTYFMKCFRNRWI